MTDTARLRQTQHSTDEPAAGSALQLASLVFAGITVGLLLWWLNGSPEVPHSLPDWGRIGGVLSGSYLPYEDVIYVATSIGWLALGYLALTIALRLVAQSLARLTDGATWAQGTLTLSDVVTLPAVRRIVDGAVAGSLFLSVWLRPSAMLAADRSSQMAVAAVASSPQAALDAGMTGATPPPIKDAVEEPASPDRVVSYTVVAGDSLWDIARRFYGDGTLYTLIFETNQGRVTTTGEPFTNPRLIRPGWILDVPLPARNVEVADSHVTYRVQSGDSLWRIAENLLGSGFRWTEIWELNQGRDMGGGRSLTDPDLILPGWLLELPIEATSASPTPPVSPPPQEPTPKTTTTASPTAEPSPTSAPEPTATQSAAVPIQPTPEANTGDGGSRWPSVGPVLAATAGLAAAGVTGMVVRRLRRNGTASLRVDAGSGRGRKPTGDVGKVMIAARALVRSLAEAGFDDVSVLSVREADRFLDFTLDCAPGDADAIVRCRYDLGRRLACAIDGEMVGPTRARLKLSRFQRLAGLLVGDDSGRTPLLIVPVGSADNAVYYLNLAATGSALVVGSQHETRQVLSAWVTTLTAICRPEAVVFLLTADVAIDLGELTRLPHFAAGTNEKSIAHLLAELEEMIVARHGAADGRGAVIALVVLTQDAASHAEQWETILRHGFERGIHIVGLSDNLTNGELLPSFAARLVFGGSDGDEENGSAVQPGELALSIGREPALVLSPVEVRSEVLRPLTRRDSRRGSEVQSEDAETVAQDESEPEPAPDDAVDAAGEETVEPESERPEVAVQNQVPTPAVSHAADSTAHEGQAARQPVLLLEADGEDGDELDAAKPVFTVRCFSSFQVETATGEVNGWTIQKARELLAYLIARGGSPVLRDEVAEALWPDSDRDQVEHLLSNAAYYLRRTLKGAMNGADTQPFVTSAQRYYLRSAMFRSEADSFDAHLRRAERLDGAEALVEYDRMMAIYRGDFLGNEPYEWAEPYRREYERRFVEASHRAAKLAVECRDVSKAVTFLQAILARDPIDEEAARGLMRCYFKLGDVNGVRKVYKVLSESLRRELDDAGAEPMPETASLMRELTS